MKKKRMYISLLSCAVLGISLPAISQQNNTAGRGTFGEKVALGIQIVANAKRNIITDSASAFWLSKKGYDSWKAHSDIAKQIDAAESLDALQRIKSDYS